MRCADTQSYTRHRKSPARIMLHFASLGGRSMNLGLEGKVVFITGGSKGLGLACAAAFAAEGSRVCISSRNEEHLRNARLTLARDGFDVAAVAADFSDPS